MLCHFQTQVALCRSYGGVIYAEDQWSAALCAAALGEKLVPFMMFSGLKALVLRVADSRSN